ncbi:Protein of unknown function [Georgenia satyanarayanai]|uniref:DUF3027 domain-containing protein n=1 Tax=Georgenia satyanarayanai TaxID=860221 RepID=A0A2Y9A9K6_9MICO|nr:DUF3027 domain-containing protein [Georgenia satyanarayanai]PYG01000.1 Protein of unknown function (DUF3027) [Georgenia satyanarayanai]SSA39239.1 Protein of unknown function [Georgenia satyanarayanai]
MTGPAVLVPRTAPPAKEAVLAGAVDLARDAVVADVGEAQVGEHAGYVVEDSRLLTHVFASLLPGYHGWYWAVTLSRPPRARRATVVEVNHLPGSQAVLAPGWVPWSQRLQPSDVGPTDELPYIGDDERLDAAYEATGIDADVLGPELAYEVGLGRERVLSAEGRSRAATRWYEGEHGPTSKGARAAAAPCSTCAFFLPLAGSLRQVFGVCANEWSPDDGGVVSLDHGCGSHSETGERHRPSDWNPTAPVIDELQLDVVSVAQPHDPPAGEPQTGTTPDAS